MNDKFNLIAELAQRIHEYIKRSMVATYLPDAKAKEITTTVNIKGVIFVAVGRRVTEQGYLSVANWQTLEHLPSGNFQVGQEISLSLQPIEDPHALLEEHTENSLTEFILDNKLGTSGTCSRHLRDTLSKNLLRHTEDKRHFTTTPTGEYLCVAFEKVGAGALTNTDLKRLVMSKIDEYASFNYLYF